VKRSSLLAIASSLVLLGAGCRQDMHDQPKGKPQSKSAFFVDGRTGRLPVEGTVARGDLREDDHLYRGKVNGVFATTFPFKIDAALMARGRERYAIYCSPCHGQTGLGNGMVIQRGFKTPAASHHLERLRNAPVGYWFDVITNGFGVMYPYAAQIPVKDRWAIIAYVRALQFSRSATLQDIPEAQREAVLAGRTVHSGGETLHVAPPPGEGGHATPGEEAKPKSESEPKSPEARH
jgi:mono/diheme cytochrome c family protein